MLPSWLAPWLPSVSLIRWFCQGLTINEYDGNTDAFPSVRLTNIVETYNVGVVIILLDACDVELFDKYIQLRIEFIRLGWQNEMVLFLHVPH